MQETTKEKIQYLERRGWKRIEPKLDFDYLAQLDMGEIIDDGGQFLAELLEASKGNPFGWFSDRAKRAQRKLMEKLSPLSVLPQVPLYVPQIEAQLPPTEYTNNEVESAFELLEVAVIDIARRRLLGTPTYIGQQIESSILVHSQPDQFDWNDSDIQGELVAQWPQAQLRLTKQISWQSSGPIVVQKWQFYSHLLREIFTAAMTDIGLEINGRAYQVGKLRPEFKLEEFPQYIQEISDKLSFQLVDNAPIERYNILVEGSPGTGKTRWAQSFAAEVLSPQGYLIAVLDYKSLGNFQLPDYLDKVCVILNDADNLCLDRESAKPGTTEKILAWLDGSRSSYIQPLYLPARSSTITILTVNTTHRWDKAGLRQGRIHAKFTFDQVLAN